jgi:hypothetical protein
MARFRRGQRKGSAEPSLISTVDRSAPGRHDAIGDDVLAELIRRLREIEASYRTVAQQMGQLYMYADQQHHVELTRSLDRPMRTASANERTLAAILDEMLVTAKRRPPRRPNR